MDPRKRPDRLLEWLLSGVSAVNDIVEAPRIIYSNELSDIVSERIGKRVHIDILDMGTSRYGSHKGPKAEQAMEYISANGGGSALLITSGSAKKAYELAAENYPNIQVVSFMERSKMGSDRLIDIKPLANGRQSICIGLPDRWFTPKTLEDFWEDLIKGDDSRFVEIGEYTCADDYSRLVDWIKGNDYEKGFDVTNTSDNYLPNPYYYPYGDVFLKGLKEHDLVLAPVGIGEFFSGILKVMERIPGECAQLLGVTTYANPLSLERASKSLAHKLDTPRAGQEHLGIIADSFYLKQQGRTVNFKGISDCEIRWAYDMYKHVIEKEHPDLATSPTGSCSLGALMNAKESIDCIEISGTYRWNLNYPSSKIIEPICIPEGARILVTNTCGV